MATIFAEGPTGLLHAIAVIEALSTGQLGDLRAPLQVFWYADCATTDREAMKLEVIAVQAFRAAQALYPGLLQMRCLCRSEIKEINVSTLGWEEDTSPREEQIASLDECWFLHIAAGSADFLKAVGIPNVNGLVLSSTARSKNCEKDGSGENARCHVVRLTAPSCTAKDFISSVPAKR